MIMRTMRFLLAMSAIGLVVGIGSRAEAELLVLDYVSLLGPGDTLGGIAFGADVPVSGEAVFNTTMGVSITQGVELFPVVSGTIEISGYGSYTVVPNPNLNIAIADPSAGLGGYGVAVGNSTGTAGFAALYGSVSDSFSASAPTPSNFSDYLGGENLFPYTIPLVGVAGGLVLDFEYTNLVCADRVPGRRARALVARASRHWCRDRGAGLCPASMAARQIARS